ncbi:MAG TPA: NUDIX domain-containing protein [Drouetiella sp.]
MQPRPSARLLVLDESNHLLLFRFEYKRGALAGHNYWATPGGGVDPGETFEQAAKRELFEETGFVVDDVGAEVESREFKLQLPDGEFVMADERYFVVRTAQTKLSNANLTELEVEVMAEHRWWSIDEIASSEEKIYPENLAELLRRIQE